MPVVEEIGGSLVLKVKERGVQGIAGNGIVSIVRTAGDGSPGTTDTYTITYDDTTTSTFSVYNGADGVGGGGGGNIPSGATMPLTPSEGDLFLHTPVGRKIIYLYSGGAWVPQVLDISAENATIYIDNVLGSDVLDNGHAAGASAFQTIAFALGAMPKTATTSNLYTALYINIGAGTYSESMALEAFRYNVDISGASTELVPSFTPTSHGLGYITLTGAGWTPDEFKGAQIRYSSSRFVIRSNTADTLYLCANYNVTADISIHSLDTTMNVLVSSMSMNTCKSVTVSSLKFNQGTSYRTAVYSYYCDSVTFRGCHFDSPSGILNTNAMNIQYADYFLAVGCWFYIAGSGVYYAVTTLESNGAVNASTFESGVALASNSAGINFRGGSMSTATSFFIGRELWVTGYDIYIGAAVEFIDCDIAITIYRGDVDSLDGATYTNCNTEIADYSNRKISFSESSETITFTAGPPDTATIPVDICKNTLYLTLAAASQITTSGIGVVNKPITLWVTHTGGPWTLSWNTIDLALEGAAGETESVLLVWNGSSWIVNRGGVVDLTI